ncbi:MAG: carbon-nitrogen hydrolase family protein [Candidatus Bipolaricaulota bacterium]|nr:carbon-nitrogen hydrolase family protein [Candidatus Bipolaricaulota bacterium]MCS7274139.1 carbon-nitrogen hydrolase family protein [Candidatus Bipolaricaulota bacterium]MDW8111312.1 carbon-nitrogen hydrolase family protein [Candidatus Bipolaricaulota bacterium]MDW8328552.1 carbon-nitrogen hydrolase family protein [Candidatus Bipolaricaulota bacterium]
MKIALVQPARDRLDRAKNLQTVTRLLEQIRNVDIVCLPENWAGVVVFNEGELADVLALLGRYAQQGRYTLLTGSLIVERRDHRIALGHVISPDGAVVGYAEKIFPSNAVGERAFLRFGERLPVFSSEKARFGVAICVDLFYPELVRSLAQREIHILFNPSNIPENRIGLWRSLLCARAAENTIFVAFANNTKSFYPDDRPVSGHSMVVSPRGEVLFEAEDAEGVYTVKIDLAQIAEARQRWPYLADSLTLEKIEDERVVRRGSP